MRMRFTAQSAHPELVEGALANASDAAVDSPGSPRAAFSYIVLSLTRDMKDCEESFFRKDDVAVSKNGYVASLHSSQGQSKTN